MPWTCKVKKHAGITSSRERIYNGQYISIPLDYSASGKLTALQVIPGLEVSVAMSLEQGRPTQLAFGLEEWYRVGP